MLLTTAYYDLVYAAAEKAMGDCARRHSEPSLGGRGLCHHCRAKSECKRLWLSFINENGPFHANSRSLEAFEARLRGIEERGISSSRSRILSRP